MVKVRADEELRFARRSLFDAFPDVPDCDDLLAFQRLLVSEILKTECEKRVTNAPCLTEHLHAVRLYGDALAFTQLSTYAIRQLARNTGKPPHLSGQGPAFALAMECSEALCQNGVPTLLADVTNVLKNGDLVACVDENAPAIIECKLSAVKDARFERQGRRGRQLSRIESVSHFLRNGQGRIFGDDRERRTVELNRFPEYAFEVVDAVVLSALEHRPITVLHTDSDLYSAALMGETAESEPVLANWGVRPGERLAVGSSCDPLLGAWPDIAPPILWNISKDARWALFEGEVTLCHVVRVDAFIGLQRGDLVVRASVEMPEPFHWGYELMWGNEPLTIGPNMLLEVLYAHETIDSAGERLLDLAQNVIEVMSVPSNQRMEPTRNGQ